MIGLNFLKGILFEKKNLINFKNMKKYKNFLTLKKKIYHDIIKIFTNNL